MKEHKHKPEKDVLVAILKEKSDWALLKEQGRYRIPLKSVPKPWPPRWLAFYQPKCFGEDAYRIRFYGEVTSIRRLTRSDIFPNEIFSEKSDYEYYILNLKQLEELACPIPSRRPRRIVFIPTTWEKFEKATQINDLFNASPLEDHMWSELNRVSIEAERQWAVQVNKKYYYLDFAIFCKNGQIDVETDGDAWHLGREQAPKDNARDNALQISGWKVLRYNTQQIRENFQSGCLREIEGGINSLGGLTSDGIVPRNFYAKGENSIQQLNLFEERENEYCLEPFPEIYNYD